MAIIVEHEKRKHEILKKSLDVFSEEGYEDVTFQKIADRCGITRTTLYIYFKNKREIFLWSIKQMMSALEVSLLEITSNESLSSAQMLKDILMKIMDCYEENKQLFGVVLDYLLQIKKTGGNPELRVRHRIIHLRHLLSKIIIRGINSGEFKKNSVKYVNELFYSVLESAIFKLAVLNKDSLLETRLILKLVVDSLVA